MPSGERGKNPAQTLMPRRNARETDSRRTGRTKKRAVNGDLLVTFRHTNRTSREPLPNPFRPGLLGNRRKSPWVALLNRLSTSLLAMAGNAIRGFELHFDCVIWLFKAVTNRRSYFSISGIAPAEGSEPLDMLEHSLPDWIEHFARNLNFLQSQVGHFESAGRKNTVPPTKRVG